MTAMFNSKRLEFFSDGVMAVAITLMVLRIAPPVASGAQDMNAVFWNETVPAIIYFLITFWVIVAFWSAHHDVFTAMGPEAPRPVLMANMAFLAVICLLPFGLEFFSSNTTSYLAMGVYAGLLALCTLSMAILAWVANGYWERSAVARMVVFLLAIPFTGLLAGWAPLVWILNFPVSRWADRHPPDAR